MIEIRTTQASDLPQIELLYSAAGYGGGVNGNDNIIVAALHGQVVGVVRLCPEDGVTVLRGMQVSQALQRQGVGAKLLQACVPHLNSAISYCLPYSHLSGFYGAASFEAVDAAELPAFLATRLSAYLTRGQDVIAMRRAVPVTTFPPTPNARPPGWQGYSN